MNKKKIQINPDEHDPIPEFDKLDINIESFVPTRPAKIYKDVLELVGNTPLVRLNKIPKLHGLQCEIIVKCEFLNPSGSLKDRIAKRMIEEAELKGNIKPGFRLIEPSSGNTGIGVALVAALKGYDCTIVMTKKMSNEKERVINALGGDVVRGEIGIKYGEKGNIEDIANELHSKNPKSFVPCQYTNPYNPLAHYEQTAEEIIYDCEGKVDMFVAGAGTGGMITGASRKLKEKLPNCKIIGVDAKGSVVGQGCPRDKFGYFDVEGIGHDYKPYTLNYDCTDKWYSVEDKNCFLMARDLIRLEGLLVGGSSGATVWAAIQACKEFNLKEGDRCVVILGDSIRNYM